MAAPNAQQQGGAAPASNVTRLPKRQLSNAEWALHTAGLWKGMAIGLGLLIAGSLAQDYYRKNSDLNQVVETYERARVFERLSGADTGAPKVSIGEASKAAEKAIAAGVTP
jgi:hypothetical protein